MKNPFSKYKSPKYLINSIEEKIELDTWFQNKNNRLMILSASLGLLLFVTVGAFAPFRNQVLNSLFPKRLSLAAELSPGEPECDGSDSTYAPNEADIQRALDNVSEGGTYHFPPCVFRDTLKINRSNITIEGSDFYTGRGIPNSRISGADVFSTWEDKGGYWESTNTVPDFGLDPVRDPDPIKDNKWCIENINDGLKTVTYFPCERQEQVYDNRQALKIISNNSVPAANEFSITSAGRKVWLRFNPTIFGALIEATTRTKWIEAAHGVNNITIRHMAFDAAANNTGQGAIELYDGWQIEDSNLARAHGAAIKISGSNITIKTSVIDHNGQIGIIGGYEQKNINILGNRISFNNTAFVNPGYEAGGIKLAAVSNTKIGGIQMIDGKNIDENQVFGNFGPGIWCDIACDDVEISGNRIYENAWYGIGYEISKAGKIHDNYIYNNGYEADNYTYGILGAGIWLSNASSTEANDNILAWNADGIVLFSQDRYCETSFTGRMFDLNGPDHAGYYTPANTALNGWLRPSLLNYVSGNLIHDNVIASDYIGNVNYYQNKIHPFYPSHLFSVIQAPQTSARDANFYNKGGAQVKVRCPNYAGTLLDPSANNRGYKNTFYFRTSSGSSFPSYGYFTVTGTVPDQSALTNLGFNGFNATIFGSGVVSGTTSASNASILVTTNPISSHSIPTTPLSFPFPEPPVRVTLLGETDLDTIHCRKSGSICGLPLGIGVIPGTFGLTIDSELRIDSTITIN